MAVRSLMEALIKFVVVEGEQQLRASQSDRIIE
jgi:hypothetical protein